MREILFRGQTRRYGEKVRMNGEKVPSHWVYGGVLQGTGDFSIIYGYDNPELKGEIQKYTVYTDTLGQYTGQDAIGNVPIFEGDIVWDDEEDERAVIYWDRDESKFVIEYEGWVADFSNTYGFELDVVGNIHDNPEMIGGAEDGK